jgi:crotonobetainyl-CoA hydratase
MPEIFAGVMGDSGCFRLTRRIPRGIAMEMLLTGRRMSAQEGYQWGLFNAVVPLDQLMDKARGYANMMIAAAPLSLAATKETIRMAETMTIEDCYTTMKVKGFPLFEKMLVSEDAQEGPRAFAEKRDPVWKGL